VKGTLWKFIKNAAYGIFDKFLNSPRHGNCGGASAPPGQKATRPVFSVHSAHSVVSSWPTGGRRQIEEGMAAFHLNQK